MQKSREVEVYLSNWTQAVRVIARPKLTGLGMHCGVLLADGTVAHNTIERGVEIVSLAEFAANRPVKTIRVVPFEKQHVIPWRVYDELASKKPYHAIENNCETFANRVTGAKPESPQANGWMLAMLLGVLYSALATR
jgi:hypothetical protein